MKIGYPCINNSISRNSPSTFRLASYSEHKLAQTIEGNLIHLNQILKYNVKNNLLFFRISSDLIPFILNSPNSKIVENSINELKYHCRVLDEMDLDATAKVQIHIGGVYGNKVEAIIGLLEYLMTLAD